MNSNRNGAFVPPSEAERFTLHQTLRTLMPETVADRLMAHLPPGGWSDVARTSDIVALREATKRDIDDLRTATKHDIDELRTATKVQFEQLGAATKHDIDDLRERVDRLEVKIDNLASMKRYVVTTGLTLAGLITGFGFAILGAVT